MPRWDSLAKQRQAKLCRLTRPWLQATGSRSDYGRLVSSQNAKKHRRRQPEAPAPTPMSLQTNEGDRLLQVGDRVKYTGGFAPTMFACGDFPLLVAGFCQVGTNAIACRSAGGKLIWIYPQDLERV